MADRPHHAHQTMEHATQFDLNDALRQWRMNLSGAPAFRLDDLADDRMA